jgi:translation elongation factor EF-1alpha
MATVLDALRLEHGDKPTLRFVSCGSVDDGKSTLVGRLLYDSKMLLDDQLTALASESKVSGTTGGDLDFALLVDGLQAEREQGITIDVAYRFLPPNAAALSSSIPRGTCSTRGIWRPAPPAPILRWC